MQQKPVVIIYTDGACKGNPGIGGYGAILTHHHHNKEIYGVALNTTNNQMELKAVIEALKVLKVPCSIDVYTDSQYVQKGMSAWIHNWKKKNWHNVKNDWLWKELDSVSKIHEIRWHWVRGHAGNKGNERADTLANLAIEEYLKKTNT